MPAPPPTRRTAHVDLQGKPAAWGVAEETAIEIGFNGEPWTVMMATPADVEDLAIGLAFTEGAISSAADVAGVSVKVWPEGITADLAVDTRKLASAALRRRALEGVTGCGLCGVETLAQAMRHPAGGAVETVDITDAAIARAFAALPAHQPLNAATRTVHAAAWCAPDGTILTAREDVGRHNALDKLIGGLLRAGGPQEPGFIVVSSRCSFELVYKAAAIGASLLASVSAPTGLALDLARAAGLALACQGPGGAVARFATEGADA